MISARPAKWNRRSLIPNQVIVETAFRGPGESSEDFMTNRAMAVAPRIVLAGVVACAAATMLHFHPASAADDCLSKPKGAAPAGQHWYYRSDRATKHQCWYLGDDRRTALRSMLANRRQRIVHQELPQSTPTHMRS